MPFIESKGFGKRRLTPMMRLMRGDRAVADSGFYVSDVGLIGIAKHDPPVAHASPLQGFQHTDGDADLSLRNAMRELTETEQQAMRTLADGRELVANPEAAGCRVIGAIRATSQCLGCHKRKQVDGLLGALSYRLETLKLGATQ